MRFAIFGAESIFTADYAETLARLGHEPGPAIVDGELEWDMDGLSAVLSGNVRDEDLVLPAGIPWVTPGLKWRKAEAARARGFTTFPSVIDPDASVARSARVEEGVYVNAGATVGAFAKLAPYTLLNRNASIGHHGMLGVYASLGPGAVVAARCSIGRGTMIGAGAVIAPGVNIGVNCLVSAGAVVTRDMPSNVMCGGNPARVVSTDYGGYKNAAVPEL